MKDTNNLKKILQDIVGDLDNIKQRLRYLENLTEEGKFLDNADIQRLVSEFVELIKMQDSLKNEYALIFENDDIPDSFADIDSKIKEFDEGIKKQREFEEARKVIGRFGSITSDDENCRTMLSEYLKKLTAIETDGKTIEEYRSETEPYEKFYEIVAIDDPALKISKTQDIYHFFEGNMLSSLMLGHFYIAGDNEPTDDDTQDDDENDELCYKALSFVQIILRLDHII